MLSHQLESKPLTEKKPCKRCGEKHGLPFHELHRALKARMFVQAVNQAAYFVSHGVAEGKIDPVIALLVVRRDLARVAADWEGCSVCRKDIVMSQEFDQYMIDAKNARLTWTKGNRWKAAGMYWKFQRSIVRGIFKWVIGI